VSEFKTWAETSYFSIPYEAEEHCFTVIDGSWQTPRGPAGGNVRWYAPYVFVVPLNKTCLQIK
jgi:hypothetical protein